MKQEFGAMEALFETALGRSHDARFGIYHDLVFFRYEEVLSAAFPRLRGALEPDEWEGWVRRFMAQGATRPLIWQTPGEFRRFLVRQKSIRKRPWIQDLLWLEWHEVALLMKSPPKGLHPLDPQKPIALSPTARVKKLRYDLGEGAIRQKTQRPYGLLLFLDPQSLLVERLEITAFMADLLKAFKHPQKLQVALKGVCKKHGLKPKEVQGILKPAWQLFGHKGILAQLL